VVIAYVLTDACLLLPAGRLADRLGHRRMFGTGLGVTALGLALCGAVSSFGLLLAARALQGVGAALVYASAPALVTLRVPDGARQQALGWYNLAVGIAMTAGPLLGGALVATWGWRAVFLARVPLALAALAVAWAGLAADPPARAGRPLAAGEIVERRAFVIANAANLVANAALFFVWLLVPYYLLDARRLTAPAAGLLFALGTLATAAAAPAGAWAAERWGGRPVAAGALGVEALGLWLTSRLDAASSPAAIGLALALGGAGVGLFAAPNMHYVMSALPPARQGWAGSLVMLMRMGGIVVGAQLATWLYDARLAAHGVASLAFRDALGVAAAIALAALLLTLVPPAPRSPGIGDSGPPPPATGQRPSDRRGRGEGG
jgi:MFS family permease